jgi:hypothetical protein
MRILKPLEAFRLKPTRSFSSLAILIRVKEGEDEPQPASVQERDQEYLGKLSFICTFVGVLYCRHVLRIESIDLIQRCCDHEPNGLADRCSTRSDVIKAVVNL